MLKNISKFGSFLNKSEQKIINGGRRPGSLQKCCDPNLHCCTTSHLAQNNSSCGGTYVSGCQYHYASGCCI